MTMRTDRETRKDADLEALRRWVGGEDDALDEWLEGRVRPIVRRPRALLSP
ncbi:MAG TPA: hypothetical protein VGR51_02325 [Thermoplasmata archaeon]|nr:hypothetical protein [Thermoplasmata archaeon]